MDAVALTRSARFTGVAGKILLTAFFLLAAGTGIAGHQSSAVTKKSSPRSGQISGHVYSAETGAPLAKAVVSLSSQEDGNSQETASVQTGPDGSFSFSALVAGKYDVSVERCGFVTQSYEAASTSSGDSDDAISLAAGQRLEGIDFQLQRGGVISGTVTDQDGEPVPGLLVQAMAFPFQPGGAQTSMRSSLNVIHR